MVAANVLNITKIEGILCGVIGVSCCALHFPSIYSAVGLSLQIGLSLVSSVTWLSGLLYLSAAQVIPDPPYGPLTSSQIAIAGICVGQVLSGRVFVLWESSKQVLLGVAPFVLWISVLTILREKGLIQLLVVGYAIVTACLALALTKQSGNRWRLCLLAVLAGQTVAATVFWMLKLNMGDPVQAFDTEVYGNFTTDDASRIGTARGNAGTLGNPMALVVTGLATVLSVQLHGSRFMNSLVRGAILLWMVVAVAPLFASGSRGPLLAAGCGVVFYAFVTLADRRTISLHTVGMIASLVLLLTLAWHRFTIQEYWLFMMNRQEAQVQETGSLIAGRRLEWSAAVEGVCASPYVGGAHITLRSYHGMEQYWVSHSTYLDVALGSGLVGLMLFLWVTFKPLFKLWKRLNQPFVASLLAVYVTAVVNNTFGSAIQVKSFWILLAMLIGCVYCCEGYELRKRLARHGKLKIAKPSLSGAMKSEIV